MLIIGHRGARGLAPENTLQSLQAGFEAGADMLEFDLRLTKDNIPILCHNSRIHGKRINRSTLHQLQAAGPITTFEEVLDAFLAKVRLNIELKHIATVEPVYTLINRHIKSEVAPKQLMISSFYSRQLVDLRRLDKHIPLALLCSINPFAFFRLNKKIHLSAVGWSKYFVTTRAIHRARQTGLLTYIHTINTIDDVEKWKAKGVDAIVTDHPDRFIINN